MLNIILSLILGFIAGRFARGKEQPISKDEKRYRCVVERVPDIYTKEEEKYFTAKYKNTSCYNNIPFALLPREMRIKIIKAEGIYFQSGTGTKVYKIHDWDK